MEDFLKFCFRFIAMVPVVLALWMVWASHFNPRRLLELSDELARELDPMTRTGMVGKAVFILGGIGIGVFAGAGVFVGLSWIPLDWGSVDSDGEWSPFRLSFAGVLGVYGAFAGSSYVVTHARLRMRQMWDRERQSG